MDAVGVTKEDVAQDEADKAGDAEEEDDADLVFPDSIPGIHDKDWVITEDSLESLVGKRIFTSDRMYQSPPPGVVMGLAYTSMGGAALYVEVTTTSPQWESTSKSSEDESSSKSERQSGNPTLQVTGKMGEVMSESSRIAHTYARRFLRRYRNIKMAGEAGFDAEGQALAEDAERPSAEEIEKERKFRLDSLEHSQLHMHVPEGAVPKDGPSAGCTMVTALLSLATGVPVRPDVAMTGEVTLTGKVLPVGGIREKSMAAKRAGVTCLILPEGCRKDVDELPAHLKAGMQFHFASEYSDVYEVAFDHKEARRRAEEAQEAKKAGSTAAGGGGDGEEAFAAGRDVPAGGGSWSLGGAGDASKLPDSADRLRDESRII